MRPLILERVAPHGSPTAARARGIAALEHEGADGPVEEGGVVVTPARELDEVPDRVRGVLREEGEGQGAVRGVDGGVADGFDAGGRVQEVGFVGQVG